MVSGRVADGNLKNLIDFRARFEKSVDEEFEELRDPDEVDGGRVGRGVQPVENLLTTRITS